MRMRRMAAFYIRMVLFVIPVIALFASNPLSLSAQEIFGSLEGKVVAKSTSQPLPLVYVIVQETSLGAATDTSGSFRIVRIPVGTYNIQFSIIGYQAIVKNNVDIRPRRARFLLVELDETAIQGEGITVTPTYFEKGKDAAASTRTMDFEDIRQDPGSAEDIQRAIQALPAVVSGSDQMNEIITRGGIPGENLFVMDELEIPNPNHFGDQGTGGGPINILNTYLIRQVDFYTGAFPARYGDKASSVLDISLREGNRDRMEGNIYAGMSGAGLMLEGPIAKGRGSWILSARKSFLDLIISQTGLTSVPYYYNLQGKAAYDLSPANTLIFNTYFGSDKIRIKAEDESYVESDDNINSNGSQYAAGLTLRTLWSDKLVSHLTFYQTENIWDIEVWEQDKLPYFVNDSREIIRELKAKALYRVSDNLELEGGFRVQNPLFRHNIWSDADTIFTWDVTQSPDRKTGIFETYPVWEVAKRTSAAKRGAFLQAKTHFLRRFTLTSGLRYDYLDYTGRSYLSPRLAFTTALNGRIALHMAYGNMNQSPSFIELTSNEKNKGLKHKRTEQYVAGMEFLLAEDQKATVEIYQKDYYDVPVGREQTTPDPFDSYEGELISVGEGAARGIEFFLQKKLSGSLQYTVSYAYSVSRALDMRRNKYYDWDYDYRNIFTFIGGYKKKMARSDWYERMKKKKWYKFTSWILPFGDEVIFSIRWRYLGGRPHTFPAYYPHLHTWVVEPDAPINNRRYPAYHRLDLRIDRRFYFKRWNLVTYFDFMNVYNRDNVWDYFYNDNGSIERVLQYKTLPVGGLAAEF